MLQQTRVETVVPYFERFLARYPRLEDLARAHEDEVLSLWSGLGYYRRARSLLAGARAVVERHGGRFPRDIEDARALPGVGPYTAAAVLSIAYGLPHPVLDGNVERVVARVLRLAANPRRASTRRAILETLARWMPRERAADFNQALMELGATVCTRAAPRCAACPLASRCAGRKRGDATRFPRLPARRPSVAVEIEAGILREGERYLLERAQGWSFLEGLWLFPLAETRAGAHGRAPDIAHVLSRKLGTEVRRGARLSCVTHSITYRRITLVPWLLEAEPFHLRGRDDFRWARLDELADRIPVSSLCLKIAARVQAAGQS
jgi:A/G-specific adenine glycosylase